MIIPYYSSIIEDKGGQIDECKNKVKDNDEEEEEEKEDSLRIGQINIEDGGFGHIGQ